MLHFLDTCCPFNGIKEERLIARAVLLDENDKVVLELMERDDEFEYSKYVETPGGGVKPHETFIDALKRELLEELGYNIEVIAPIEVVEDYYNLIYRKNINHYYLCRIISKVNDLHQEELEKIIIKGETHLSFDEAISEMKKNVGTVGKLVLQRELPILELAKKMYMEKKQ